MEIKIKRVDNGYIVTINDHFDRYQELIFDETPESFLDMCFTLQDAFGLLQSRHDKERIYHIIAPGDKHEDWTEEHSRVIFGEDE